MCDGVGVRADGVRDRLDFDLRGPAVRLFRVGVALRLRNHRHTGRPRRCFVWLLKASRRAALVTRSAHRRMVWLTSALSKVGEQGIPADTIVRTCFGGRSPWIIIEIVSLPRDRAW